MSVWNTLTKAQAKALKDALTTQSYTLTLSQCREARSRLAGYPNWNPYCAFLKEGRASTRLPDQPERLVQELIGDGVSLTLEEARLALARMQEASAEVWEIAAQQHGLTFTTLHVHSPDSVDGEEVRDWIEENEAEILESLELARPFHRAIYDGIPEAAPYLQELFEVEGPGYLTQAWIPQEEAAWFYTRTLMEAHILATLFAQHPDRPTFTIGTSGFVQPGRKPVTRQVLGLWNTREGLETYRASLQAKYGPDFPRYAGGPGAINGHDPALVCWEAAELMALEARLTPAPHPGLSGEWERVQPEQVQVGDTLLIDFAVAEVGEIEQLTSTYFSFYSTDGGVWDLLVTDPLWRKFS